MYDSKYTGEQVEGILDKAQNSAYTKSEVDQAISDATSALTPVDLSNYYTSAQTDTLLNDKASKSAALGGYSYGASSGIDYLKFNYADSSTHNTNNIYYPKINGVSIMTSNQTYAGNNYDFQLATKTEFGTHSADTSIHVTSAQTASWDAKSDFSGSYNDLTDKPTIPDVSNYYTSAETEQAITNKDKLSLKSVGIGGSNNENYLQYVNGSGQTFISFWFAKINNQSVVGNQTSSFSFPTLSEFQTHTGDTTVHVTQADKTTWNKITTDYYTKTEIDGMIGDVESLLASI